MTLSTLREWEEWIQKIHRKSIDLGLERVKTVWKRLFQGDFGIPIITVGGTNGKGSTVKTVETIYLDAGYKVGAFTSPYLFRFNEYVRVDGVDVQDDVFVRLFSRIEQERKDITLTFFEFAALAALLHFSELDLDVCILEVGLGGRLDAVNMMDADVSIVTSVGLDHQAYLGDTREAIGLEKVEIARRGKPFLCGDKNPPEGFLERAQEIGAEVFCFGTDFEVPNGVVLPSFLVSSNAACAMKAVTLLQEKLPVDDSVIRKALSRVMLTGRLQVISERPLILVDVSHNADSVRVLSNWLTQHACSGKTRAVFSMLSDKDIHACLEIIREKVDEWYAASLNSERASGMERLQAEFGKLKIQKVSYFDSIEEAFFSSRKEMKEEDRVVVFGSFQTVGRVLELDK